MLAIHFFHIYMAKVVWMFSPGCGLSAHSIRCEIEVVLIRQDMDTLLVDVLFSGVKSKSLQ
jgi:hypothetical protein